MLELLVGCELVALLAVRVVENPKACPKAPMKGMFADLFAFVALIVVSIEFNLESDHEGPRHRLTF